MYVSHGLRLWVVVLVVLDVYLYTEAAKDFARGKPASMSSTFNSSYTAGNAVDGDKDTYILTELNQSYAWWRVDLQETVTYPNVKVTFNHKPELPNFQYTLRFFTSTEYFPSPDSASWSPPSGVKNPWDWSVHSRHFLASNTTFRAEMRYLLIYTTGNITGQGAFLDFKEVEVWGGSSACRPETGLLTAFVLYLFSQSYL